MRIHHWAPYSCTYLFLAEEETSFRSDQSTPITGVAKIEIGESLGTLSLAIQGLDSNKKPYVVCGLNQDGSPITLGNLNVADSGEGRLEVKFDPNNILESGSNLEELATLALYPALAETFQISDHERPVVAVNMTDIPSLDEKPVEPVASETSEIAPEQADSASQESSPPAHMSKEERNFLQQLLQTVDPWSDNTVARVPRRKRRKRHVWF